jgi:hypothetical protein
VVDLGIGDIALLNYAYALEQLEAAFYTAIMASPYSGMIRYERSVLSVVKGLPSLTGHGRCSRRHLRFIQSRLGALPR